MCSWDSSGENNTHLRFLETFVLLLVSQLVPGPSGASFLNGRALSLQSLATHIGPLGWLGLSAVLFSPQQQQGYLGPTQVSAITETSVRADPFQRRLLRKHEGCHAPPVKTGAQPHRDQWWNPSAHSPLSYGCASRPEVLPLRT